MWQLRAASLLGVLLLASVEAAVADPRRVMLLHSFSRNYAPWSLIAARLQEHLTKDSPHAFDIYEASLATERLGPSYDAQPFLQYLRTVFAGHDPDLTITVGAPAGRFMLQHRAELFPSAPLLLTGADPRTFANSGRTPGDVVIPVVLDHAKQVDNIVQLLPDTRHIAVVIGASNVERFWLEELKRTFEPYQGKLTFEYFDNLTLDGIVQRVAALPPHSAVYYGSLRVDAQGVSYAEERALARIREATNAPIFSFADSNFGAGIVGGPMLSIQEIAEESAQVAERLLRGAAPASIVTTPIRDGTPRYDGRELDRWNISESRLPAGSKILFREAAGWEQYRTHLMAIVAALLLQTGLISWLLYEHRRRHVAEVQSRGLMSELTQMNRLATAGELSASIAHEISQPLTRVMASAGVAMRALTEEPADVAKALELLRHTQGACDRAVAILASTRAMFAKDDGNRGPVDLNTLIRSVLMLVRYDLRQHDVHVEQRFDDPPLEVLGDKIQLQQVILNLVMNAIEAMQSRKIRVLRLACTRGSDGKIAVSVADTGSGIAPDHMARIFDPLFSTKQRGMGMGLAICRSIIEGHDGKISAAPAPEGGSIFRLELPPYDEERRRAPAPSPPPSAGPAADTAQADTTVATKAVDPGGGTDKPAAA